MNENDGRLSRGELLDWLREDDREKTGGLLDRADRVRARSVGDEVHLRGLIDFGNICCRECLYCGLRLGNKALPRFRMKPEEILDSARDAARFGYGTVVLQSGEDEGMTAAWFADVVRQIKELGLSITISVGERPLADYRLWRDAGADRMLLKFETSDPELYARLHPARPGLPSRIEILKACRGMGYEIGSGFMVGLPGQSFDTLASDLLLLRELDIDMIGNGPFIPNPDTPLGPQSPIGDRDSSIDQVPATPAMTLKVIALTRLLRPDANLPATTALATLSHGGYVAGLRAGANVIMPQVSPPRFRELYRIYPGVAPLSPDQVFHGVMHDIQSAGRRPGTGPGPRRKNIEKTRG